MGSGPGHPKGCCPKSIEFHGAWTGDLDFFELAVTTGSFPRILPSHCDAYADFVPALPRAVAPFWFGRRLIFLVYSMSSGPSPDTIVLGRETVDAIVRERCEESGRPLSESERSAAIDDLVDEEVLVREAYKEGIDRNDSVVARACGKNAVPDDG